MNHRLFTILSAVSLLLCVATMVLWILGTWVVLRWGYCGATEGHMLVVWSAPGNIEVVYYTKLTNRSSTGFHAERTYPALHFGWGFAMHVPHDPIDIRPLYFVIPDWFIGSITAVLPFLWYRRYRRRLLAERKGHCPKCGDDLRASPERCPECGTPVVVSGTKA